MSTPAWNPFHVVPPSVVKKVKTSRALAVVVLDGIIPCDQSTLAGQVVTRPPVLSCLTTIVKPCAELAEALIKLNVQLAVRVMKKLLLPFKSTLYAAPELAVVKVS